MPEATIDIRGARQNNLKGFDLALPLNELIVVTGVSGSGKSSLAFDTIYAEGQRRYVETFSPYARQFLERMDKPRADRIDGIPPAIAIDQTNPVRTSRSTVGTMTELNDHIKLLFARAARLYCRACGRRVERDTPESIFQRVCEAMAPRGDAALLVTFPARIRPGSSPDEARALLARDGYTRFLPLEGDALEVVQDRLRFSPAQRTRFVEDIEAAFEHGGGRVAIRPIGPDGQPEAPLPFSADLHCAACDIHYRDPVPNTFSFNSPIGACDICRGFGRVIGIDYDLVIPDKAKTLAGGAVKPWQSASQHECQDDLLKSAKRRGIPVDVPWYKLTDAQRAWVIDGEGRWEDGLWYGVKRFFEWLEARSYRMHIRVLLSRYRAYRTCTACGGARLKPESLLWRIGPEAGMTMHQVQALPISDCAAFFHTLPLPAAVDEATALLLGEIRTRLDYLIEVGLGYLTLDRQSRTLSGGEVQRINLTTALGTSLVNTLFVLDEPSIGLHPRDISRLVGVLHRLRDAGNTLIVVEHDPEVIRAADRVIDLGPGPGERGGEIVFQGSVRALLRSRRSLTAQYLSGRRTVVESARQPRAPGEDGSLRILGARAHNLKDIDVTIPLHRLVCITGVSGSGKSTMVQDVLYYGLRTLKSMPLEQPGAHRAIEGHEQITDVVLVDQSPIGKTTRSNPASYVGALDPIRALFAREPLARERTYTAGTFSFNAGTGRCPACSGNGFQHIEMQFLSDVYLRCPDCDGKRYRQEVLDVTLDPPANAAATGARATPQSIADVLDMTVSEARAFFAAHPDVLRGLEPLDAVGLGYMKLGQPVPTLSGGEAQRLKLAGHLATAVRPGDERHTLFLFDEPTTGLHFDDIATLLRALHELVARGHSVIVIEHNLDVIRAADWIIDLGPEGGDAGGRIVYKGMPADIAACAESHTGAALRAASAPMPEPPRTRGAARATRQPQRIRVHNAREHNLKGIDLSIPRDTLTVITGVSGSGKSTVAFDILFGEGQRRYLESLNAYARQFVQPAARPDVDALYGIPPTVAIEQRISRGGRKSTVATVTELHHFLRLLFVKLGVQHCPDCNVPIRPQSVDMIAAQLLRDCRGKRVTILAPLVRARKGYYTDLAAWAAGKGITHLRVDGVMTPVAPWPRLDRFREHDIEMPVGAIDVSPAAAVELRALIARAAGAGKGVLHALPARGRAVVLSTLRACPSCGRGFTELDPRLFSYNSKHGWCTECYGTGLQLRGFDEEQTGEEIWWNAWWDGPEKPCPACHGRRLRPEALAVRYRGRTIDDYAALSVRGAAALFAALRLDGREEQIARDIVAEIRARLAFLGEVGLAYLTLDRAAPTLSGGEAQRIRLAAQLGSNLRGVCYILDEPTIGLHARDNRMLLHTLEGLQAKGNTVVVVEHDDETIRRAGHVIDLGPGAGRAGGEVVAAGSVAKLMRSPRSVTGRLLRAPLRHPFVAQRPVTGRTPSLRIERACLHNLRNVTARVPLGRLVCVTGVSGSGKSTLVRDILHDNLARMLARAGRRARTAFVPSCCKALRGADRVARVLEVDQTPIGKTPRSCPATYVGIWDDIRRIFAGTAEARMRGYGPSRFSFNTKGGRCEQCEGQGVRKIEMSFLPDVTVKCDACGGARFGQETLAVHFKGASIANVLAMSVDEAAAFFAAHASVSHALRLLQDVGLGYLALGQQSPTLSGGEAQRIKLVRELARTKPADEAPRPDARRAAPAAGTLYVLDEPTIGLHMADVEKLVRVLHRLVDAGHSVVIIEHNLDVIAEADWVIDLGPEGGDEGGRIVACGPPEQVARAKRTSHTGAVLAGFLKARTR
ncbi:excinuclease ABC subunit UvrA [bacterium]|nr:excinuclease ABC subunit UvrA [bacterium]